MSYEEFMSTLNIRYNFPKNGYLNVSTAFGEGLSYAAKKLITRIHS